MDIASLHTAVQGYYRKGLAPATHKSYQAGQKRYMEFCREAKKSPVPTSEETLLLFVVHLAQQGLAHATIKVYLSAVRNLHVTTGLHREFTAQLTPKLELVMKGIKKEKALNSPRTRLPITIDIMSKLKSTLGVNSENYDNIMLWAACALAFFGFLRCSEFTVPSQEEYCPTSHLSLEDIVIDSRISPTMIQVTIKQSKTDPFRVGCKLCLGKTGRDICPITAILPYLAIRGDTYGPLFILANGSYLTRQRFSALLSETLQKAGVDSRGYNTHSFRIGAATTAKENGVSDVHIKMLGRWQSSAYQLYIRTPQEQLAKLSKQLVASND